MYIATNGNLCFEGETVDAVVENAINSDVDYEEMNFLNWTWYKASPCTLKVELLPKVGKKAPVVKK